MVKTYKIKNLMYKQILNFKFNDFERYEFLNKLLDNCNIDTKTGDLFCKSCKNLVRINWSLNIGYCGVHKISKNGITLNQESYKIYL